MSSNTNIPQRTQNAFKTLISIKKSPNDWASLYLQQLIRIAIQIANPKIVLSPLFFIGK